VKEFCTMLTVLFPASPLSARLVEPDFAPEMEAAIACGFPVGLLQLETLLEGDMEQAVARVPKQDSASRFVYRGWMITSGQYALLVDQLARRGYEPLTSPQDYQRHHEYPGAWSSLSHLMPRSLVIGNTRLDDVECVVEEAARTLSGAVLIKDYVKSRKHEWKDACFIPDIADHSAAARVVSTFLERQGESLQGGLVFRELLDLVNIGHHPKSKLPLPLEFRSFFFGKEVLCTLPYWDEADYETEVTPPEEFLREVAERMGGGFFTVDTALAKDGRWYVIETGDGQVSQIPDRMPLNDFYTALRSRTSSQL
jgi:hypothetical protein